MVAVRDAETGETAGGVAKVACDRLTTDGWNREQAFVPRETDLTICSKRMGWMVRKPPPIRMRRRFERIGSIPHHRLAPRNPCFSRACMFG